MEAFRFGVRAARSAVMRSGDDFTIGNEQSADGWIGTGASQSLSCFDQGETHKALIHSGPCHNERMRCRWSVIKLFPRIFADSFRVELSHFHVDEPP
jgi:hypothetical protein